MRDYLSRLTAMLGPEERMVVESIATECDEDTVIACAARLHAGEKAYGRLHLATDDRDFDEELRDELLDAVNYRHMKRVQCVLRDEPIDELPLPLEERVAALELENAELRAQLEEDAEVVFELDTSSDDEPN